MPTFPLGKPNFCDPGEPPEQRSYSFKSDAGPEQVVITQHVPSGATFTARYEHLTIEQKTALDDFWLETKCNNIPFEIPVEVFRQPIEVRKALWRQTGYRNSWKFKEKYSTNNGQVDVDNECSYYTASMTFVGYLDPSAPQYPPTAEELLSNATFYYRFDDTSWSSALGGTQYNLLEVGNVTTGPRLCGTSGSSASFNGSSYLRTVSGGLGLLSGDNTIALAYRNTSNAIGSFTLMGKYDLNNLRGWMIWLDCTTAGQEIIKFSYSPDGSEVTTIETPPLSRSVSRLVTVERSVAGGFTRMSFNTSQWITERSVGLLANSTVPLSIGCAFSGGTPINYFTGLIDGVGIYTGLWRREDILFVWNNGVIRQL